MKPQDRTRAILDSALPAPWKLILVTVADHMNGDDSGAFPGMARLVQKSSLSESSLHRHIKAMQAARLVERTSRGLGLSPLTSIRWEEVSTWGGGATVTPGASMTPGGATVTPGGCQVDTGGGATVTPEATMEDDHLPDQGSDQKDTPPVALSGSPITREQSDALYTATPNGLTPIPGTVSTPPAPEALAASGDATSTPSRSEAGSLPLPLAAGPPPAQPEARRGSPRKRKPEPTGELTPEEIARVDAIAADCRTSKRKGPTAHPLQREVTDAWMRAWRARYGSEARYPWQLQGRDRALVVQVAEAAGLDEAGADIPARIADLEAAVGRYLTAADAGKAWPPEAPNLGAFALKVAAWLAPPPTGQIRGREDETPEQRRFNEEFLAARRAASAKYRAEHPDEPPQPTGDARWPSLRVVGGGR